MISMVEPELEAYLNGGGLENVDGATFFIQKDRACWCASTPRLCAPQIL